MVKCASRQTLFLDTGILELKNISITDFLGSKYLYGIRIWVLFWNLILFGSIIAYREHILGAVYEAICTKTVPRLLVPVHRGPSKFQEDWIKRSKSMGPQIRCPIHSSLFLMKQGLAFSRAKTKKHACSNHCRPMPPMQEPRTSPTEPIQNPGISAQPLANVASPIKPITNQRSPADFLF